MLGNPTLAGMIASITLLSGLQSAAAETVWIYVDLIDLGTHDLDDGDFGFDNTVEAYGTLTIGGEVVTWNNHNCEPGLFRGCLTSTSPPYTTDVPWYHGAAVNWADMHLRHDRGGFRRNNNRVTLVREGRAAIARPLRVSFTFLDHDSDSPDDVWCAVSNAVVIPAGRRAGEWDKAGVTRHMVAGSAEDGDCDLELRVAVKVDYSP